MWVTVETVDSVCCPFWVDAGAGHQAAFTTQTQTCRMPQEICYEAALPASSSHIKWFVFILIITIKEININILGSIICTTLSSTTKQFQAPYLHLCPLSNSGRCLRLNYQIWKKNRIQFKR